jgi:hypothetical protein
MLRVETITESNQEVRMTLQTIKDAIQLVEDEHRKLSFFFEHNKQNQSQTILNLLFDQWKKCVQSKSEKKLQEYLFLSEDVVLEKLEIQKQGENSEISSSDLNQPLSRLNGSIKKFYRKYNNDKKCTDSLVLKIKRNNGKNLRLEPENNGKSIVIWAYVKLLEQIPPSDKSLTAFVSAKSVLVIKNDSRTCSPSPEFFRTSGPEFVDFENDYVFIDEKQIKDIQNKLKDRIVVLEAGPASGKSVLARAIAYKRIKKDPLNQFTTVFYYVSNNEIERVSELAERVSLLNENNLLIIEDAHLNSRLINQLLQRWENFKTEILITTRRIDEIPGGEKNLFNDDDLINKKQIKPTGILIEEIITRYLRIQKNQFQLDLKNEDIKNIIEENYYRHFFYNVNLWLLSFLLDALKRKKSNDQIFIEKHEIVRAVENHLDNRIGSLFEQEGKKPLAIKLLIALSCLYRFEFLTDIYWLQERFCSIGYNKDDVITVLQKLHRFREVRSEGKTLYGLHHSSLAELYFAVGQARYLPWQEEKVYGDYGDFLSSYVVSSKASNGLSIFRHHGVRYGIGHAVICNLFNNNKAATPTADSTNFKILSRKAELICQRVFEHIDIDEFSKFLIHKWGKLIESENICFYWLHSYIVDQEDLNLIKIKVCKLKQAIEVKTDLSITICVFSLVKSVSLNHFNQLLNDVTLSHLTNQILLSDSFESIQRLFKHYRSYDSNRALDLWALSKEIIYDKAIKSEDYEGIISLINQTLHISDDIGNEFWNRINERFVDLGLSFNKSSEILHFLNAVLLLKPTNYKNKIYSKLSGHIKFICHKSDTLFEVVELVKILQKLSLKDAEEVRDDFFKKLPMKASTFNNINEFSKILVELSSLGPNYLKQFFEIVNVEIDGLNSDQIFDAIFDAIEGIRFYLSINNSIEDLFSLIPKNVNLISLLPKKIYVLSQATVRKRDIDSIILILVSIQNDSEASEFKKFLKNIKPSLFNTVIQYNNHGIEMSARYGWLEKIYSIDAQIGEEFLNTFWNIFISELRSKEFKITSPKYLTGFFLRNSIEETSHNFKYIIQNDLLSFLLVSWDISDLIYFFELMIDERYKLAVEIWNLFDSNNYFDKIVDSDDVAMVIGCIIIDLQFDPQHRIYLWEKTDKDALLRKINTNIRRRHKIIKSLTLLMNANEAYWDEIKNRISIKDLARVIATSDVDNIYDLLITIWETDFHFGLKLWYEIFNFCPVQTVFDTTELLKKFYLIKLKLHHN